MTNVLFIKTSSLGDVIHHMPALTDAHRERGDATFTWLVEEAFAPLVRLHPAVAEVIPVASRRWRKSLYKPATLSEIAASLRDIRTRRYDDIVDSQELCALPLLHAQPTAAGTVTTTPVFESPSRRTFTMFAITSIAICTPSNAIES